MNDITFSPDGRYLYAGTYGGPGWSTGAGLLVRIPVNDDGSAAPAELFTSGLGCNDGLETAADGSIYFADTCNGDIWAYTLYASRRLLLASREVYGDPLDDATSLVLLNSCLYNTELGYFKLQQGLADQTSRSAVEFCDLENPLTSPRASFNPPALAQARAARAAAAQRPPAAPAAPAYRRTALARDAGRQSEHTTVALGLAGHDERVESQPRLCRCPAEGSSEFGRARGDQGVQKPARRRPVTGGSVARGWYEKGANGQLQYGAGPACRSLLGAVVRDDQGSAKFAQRF